MPRNDPIATVLRTIPALADLPDRRLSPLTRLVTEAALRPGEVLTRQGAHGTEAFIVLDGRAEVVMDGTVVAAVGPGEFVGELALMDGGVRSATVRALTAMRVLVLSRREFRSFVEHPDGARAVALNMARRVRQGNERNASGRAAALASWTPRSGC